MRLDRYISSITGLSRRDVKAALSQGRVRVDDQPARDPARQLAEASARVELDGRLLEYRRHRHIMLNKPAGVLTATEDRAQPTVLDLIPEPLRARGLNPVGRLDKDVTGLLLLTTDGQLAHRLISPRHHVDKVYLARVDGALDEADAHAFERGMELGDFTALPARLEILERDLARVTLGEGKYHQVKRMFASRAKPVVELRRVRMGAIALDERLEPGQCRELSADERRAIYRCAGMDAPD